MSITVITSLCGKKDNLIHNQCKGEALWKAYLDEDYLSDTWDIKTAYDKFKSPRRNSRVPKLLIHKFANTEYSIWIDGNIKLLISPEELIKRYLKNHDIAVFRHPVRNCIYKEAIECAKRGLDNVETIIEQAKSYEIEGYPKEKGLGECMMILRRHTPQIESFNNAWWTEYTRFSVRDQISFMYALSKAKIECHFIDEQFRMENDRYLRGDILEIIPHLTDQKIGN